MNQNHVMAITQTCTGCSACQAVCPIQAISMQYNQDGFLEPSVDETRCIQCGKCLNTCPLGKESPKIRQASYYGWHQEDAVCYKSTSGGAFRGFADKILEENGVVFGATYNQEFTEVIFSDSDSCLLEHLQKSKYIVSNPIGAFQKVKEQLESGRRVLFSGAPCQVAGLSRFLGKEYEKLITVDFVCGGMPSLRFWQEHLVMLEKKYGAKVKSVDFRSKRNGWGKGYLEIIFENGKTYFTRDYLDSFYHCFCDCHINVRNTCLDCEFHEKHFSDITIADFWGFHQLGIEGAQRGLSLIISNSEKGTAFVEGISNLYLQKMDNKYSDYAVAKLRRNEEEHQSRNAFFALAKSIGFERAAKKCCPATTVSHILKYIKLRLNR